MAFDNSGTRLITAEADKTIKLYREDDTAVSILLGVSMINDKILALLYFYFTLLNTITIIVFIC